MRKRVASPQLFLTAADAIFMIQRLRLPTRPVDAIGVLNRIIRHFDGMPPDRQTEVAGLMTDILRANEHSRALAARLSDLLDGSWLSFAERPRRLPSPLTDWELLRPLLENGLRTPDTPESGDITEILFWIARSGERGRPPIFNVVSPQRIETWIKTPTNVSKTPHLHPRLDITPEIQWLEDRIVDDIDFQEGKHPTVLLLGPGFSTTDPLYALRILYKLGKKSGLPGQLIVYDLEDRPEIREYYSRLPLGPHQLRLYLGNQEGNFLNMIGAGAHVALMFHPNIETGTNQLIDDEEQGAHVESAQIRKILIDNANLTSGGIAVLQTDLYANTRRANLKRMVDHFMSGFGSKLHHFLPPRFSALFRTRYANVEGPRDIVLTLQHIRQT